MTEIYQSECWEPFSSIHFGVPHYLNSQLVFLSGGKLAAVNILVVLENIPTGSSCFQETQYDLNKRIC